MRRVLPILEQVEVVDALDAVAFSRDVCRRDRHWSNVTLVPHAVPPRRKLAGITATGPDSLWSGPFSRCNNIALTIIHSSFIRENDSENKQRISSKTIQKKRSENKDANRIET